MIKRLWPLIVAIVAIAITVVLCCLGPRAGRPLTGVFATKRQCSEAGGSVIESGIDGWWFCCSGEVCYSCVGEIAGSMTQNCELDSPITGPTNPSDGSTATLLISIQKKHLIPNAVWARLDPICRERLLRDPSAFSGCRLVDDKAQ